MFKRIRGLLSEFGIVVELGGATIRRKLADTSIGGGGTDSGERSGVAHPTTAIIARVIGKRRVTIEAMEYGF